jgi:hypothetical protein
VGLQNAVSVVGDDVDDVRPVVPINVDDKKLHSNTPVQVGAIYSVTEGLVAREAFVIDPARPGERWYYEAGLDTMLDGMTAASSKVVLYGLQGPGRLWLSLDP